MGDTGSVHLSAGEAFPAPVSGQSLEGVLFELEEHYGRLCTELAAVEARLRQLRTAAEVCPMCGGSGERWVRGGLYGELQQRPCPCQG